MQPKGSGEGADTTPRNPVKNKKALALANEQYQQLREALHATPDVQQKNVIFRRLINLLDVIHFLNSDNAGPSH